MKTMRLIGVLGLATTCLGGAAASADSEDPAVKAEGKHHAKGEAKVNINEASKADLMKLEGVSAGMAQKIIAYREAHGPFKRAHDLEKVDGVGKVVLEKNPGRISFK